MTTPKYPLICFDLDGTLVDDTVYIWKTLHEGFETDEPERKKAYEDYFAGRITYKQWFDHDLKLLKAAGANRKTIDALLDVLTEMNGASQTLHRLRNTGHKVAIISGSIDIVVDRLFPDFPFDHVLVNRIHFDSKGQIAGGMHTPYDVEAKADGLKELCRREGIATSQSVFVGDNENDLWIAKEAGFTIAFNCKSEKLAQIADVEIKEKNMELILPHIT